MLNPLKIATDGYLKKGTKAVLIIAVAGYLNYTTPSGGSSQADGYEVYNYEEQNPNKELVRLQREDNEILLLLKTYVEQCL